MVLANMELLLSNSIFTKYVSKIPDVQIHLHVEGGWIHMDIHIIFVDEKHVILNINIVWRTLVVEHTR